MEITRKILESSDFGILNNPKKAFVYSKEVCNFKDIPKSIKLSMLEDPVIYFKYLKESNLSNKREIKRDTSLESKLISLNKEIIVKSHIPLVLEYCEYVNKPLNSLEFILESDIIDYCSYIKLFFSSFKYDRKYRSLKLLKRRGDELYKLLITNNKNIKEFVELVKDQTTIINTKSGWETNQKELKKILLILPKGSRWDKCEQQINSLFYLVKKAYKGSAARKIIINYYLELGLLYCNTSGFFEEIFIENLVNILVTKDPEIDLQKLIQKIRKDPTYIKSHNNSELYFYFSTDVVFLIKHLITNNKDFEKSFIKKSEKYLTSETSTLLLNILLGDELLRRNFRWEKAEKYIMKDPSLRSLYLEKLKNN